MEEGSLSKKTCTEKFVWKVTRFRERYLYANNITNELHSPYFSICDRCWYVSLGINKDENGQQQLEIYLMPSGTEKNDVLLNCTFTLYAHDTSSGRKDQLASKRFTHLFFKDSGSGLGFPAFVHAKAVTRSDITVDVLISAAIHAKDLPFFTGEDAVKANLKILRSGITPDVTFIVEERHLTAHREVLSALSKVFQRMFNTEVEAMTGKIVVLDVKANIFDKFLDFLYTGAYPENFDVLAEDLFALAHKYEVDSLKELCIAHFGKMDLDHKSAVTLLLLSDKYQSLDVLQGRIVDYLKRNLDFLESAEWEELKTTAPGKSIELLTHYIKSEAKK